jgi:hypothetical protein
MEKVFFTRTADRVVTHRPLSVSSVSVCLPSLSVTQSDFPPHPISAFPPKIFNQTGSHWHHDENQSDINVKEGQGGRKDNRSQIHFSHSSSTDYETTNQVSNSKVAAATAALQSRVTKNSPARFLDSDE